MNELQLGVGISYRPKWRSEVLSAHNGLGCIEIIAEHYLDCSPEKLEELDSLRSKWPVIPHGLGLSLGTDAPLDQTLVRKLAQLVELVEPPWFTEHLAFTGVPGWPIGHLAPLPLTHEAVDVVCRNVQRCREMLGVPLLLENIAYLVSMPGQFSEAQFITQVLERADCGLLLDLHNVYANALNHDYDPVEFLASMPLHRVGQIHLAGGRDEKGYRIDSHGGPVPEPVWDLLRWVAPRIPVSAVIVEWDVNLPSFGVIQREAEQADAILRGELIGVA